MKSKILIFFFCIISLNIAAQPCSSATKLTNVTNYCSNNAEYNNTPVLNGTTTVAACWTGNPTQDVWYSFTSTQTDVLISVNGSGTGGGTIINPCIALYNGPCAANLIEIACVNATSNATQLYKGGLAPGKEYLIRISSTTANKGTFKLCVNNYTPTINPGADCGGSAYICNKNSISVPVLSGGGSNTAEPEIGSCGGGVAESNSCWYNFTCQTSGTLTFDLVPTDVNNDLDFIFYELSGTNVCSGRTVLRCNFHGCQANNGPTGLNATSTDISVAAGTCAIPARTYCKQVNLVAGTSYALFINDFNGNSGFTINWGGTSTFLGPVPKIVASDTTICAGESVIFNGSTSTNWTSLNWNFSSGGSPVSATGAGPHTVTYNAAGSYVAILEGVSVGGCKTVKSINVIVSPIPTVTIATPGVLTCSANSIPLTATASPLPVTYTWTGPGIVSGGTTANPSVNAPGAYIVTVTNPTGCTATATVTVTQQGMPSAITSKTDVSCNGGSDGTATVTASGGTSPYTYSWSPSGGVGITASSLIAGTYTVTVKDNIGCVVNATATIAEPLAVSLTTSKTDANCGGVDGSASVTASNGTGPYTYSWNTTPAQLTATATGLLAGPYIVTVTDSKGCTQTASVNVADIGSPSIVTSKVDVSCNGAANGSITTTVTGGVPPYAYNWSNSETTPGISGLVAGSYTLTLTGANNCKAIAIVTIAEPSVLVLSTTVKDASCGAANGSSTVSATGGIAPYTYSWTTSPVQTTATASNIPSGGYTVTVRDFNGCTQTAAVTINNIGAPKLTTSFTNVKCNGGATGAATVSASGGVTPYLYSWNSTPAKTTDTVSGLKAGTYVVTVTAGNGCITTASVIISQPPAIVLATTSTDENCNKKNGTVTVKATGGTGSYTYLWNSSPVQTTPTATGLSAGNYTAIVYDSMGCSQSASKSLVNIAGPVAGFTLSSACINTPIAFTNTSPSSVTSWQWDFGDGISSNLKDPSHMYTLAGKYPVKLFIEDAAGCKDSITKNVTVYPPPVVVFGDSTIGCSPLTVTFTNNSTPSMGSSYLWNFGNNVTSTHQFPVYKYVNTTSVPISYNVSLTVISENGCRSSLTHNNLITVYPTSSAVFIADKDVTDIWAPTIRFYNQSVGNKSNLWTFGDGDSSLVLNPVHTYKEPGEYKVCLYVVNDNGCKDVFCSMVIIKPTWSFYIPNAFTPNNGDEKNDKFRGYGENILEYEMMIFDRWGNKIFTAHDIADGWDGKANKGAKTAQSDVYVYVVILRDVFKVKHRYTGTVTLVR